MAHRPEQITPSPIYAQTFHRMRTGDVCKLNILRCNKVVEMTRGRANSLAWANVPTIQQDTDWLARNSGGKLGGGGRGGGCAHSRLCFLLSFREKGAPVVPRC